MGSNKQVLKYFIILAIKDSLFMYADGESEPLKSVVLFFHITRTGSNKSRSNIFCVPHKKTKHRI